MSWKNDKPTEEGFYWVWQPLNKWPCKGKVHLVMVEKNHTRLTAWVPYMDYTNELDMITWDHSMWMKAEVPDSP